MKKAWRERANPAKVMKAHQFFSSFYPCDIAQLAAIPHPLQVSNPLLTIAELGLLYVREQEAIDEKYRHQIQRQKNSPKIAAAVHSP
jgi:hypothetical protein